MSNINETIKTVKNAQKQKRNMSKRKIGTGGQKIVNFLR